MSRFDAWQQDARPKLIAYLMAGDPDAPRAMEYARAVLRAGADALELGVPFSDPVADGPTIQKAAARALDNGTRLAHVLQAARNLRAQHDQPLVLMTYYNPVFQRGLARFAREAREAGVDGIILPDVPLEESGPAREALAAQQLDLIQLASPATPDGRLASIAQASRGFLYLVSSYGTTGASGGISEDTRQLVMRAKKHTQGEVPLAVGFGVSTPADVKALASAGADAIIVGSAIVRLVERGAPPAQVEAFVRDLKRATTA